MSDAGPLLPFARAGGLDLLKAATGKILIPEAVYRRTTLARTSAPGAAEIAQATWIRHQVVANRILVSQLPAKPHAGEREALVPAKELGATLLVDERDARLQAQLLGIPYFGSLRVLKELKDRALSPPSSLS